MIFRLGYVQNDTTVPLTLCEMRPFRPTEEFLLGSLRESHKGDRLFRQKLRALHEIQFRRLDLINRLVQDLQAFDDPIADATPDATNKRNWNDLEKELFRKAVKWLKAKSDLGLDVKLIAAFVKTRTPIQVRTHAQKFFRAHRSERVGERTAERLGDDTLSGVTLSPEEEQELLRLQKEIKERKVRKRRAMENGVRPLIATGAQGRSAASSPLGTSQPIFDPLFFRR